MRRLEILIRDENWNKEIVLFFPNQQFQQITARDVYASLINNRGLLKIPVSATFPSLQLGEFVTITTHNRYSILNQDPLQKVNVVYELQMFYYPV